MRILVGYDGTVPADGALYDLSEAGLPPVVDALVLAAAAPWAPFGAGGDPAASGAAAGRGGAAPSGPAGSGPPAPPPRIAAHSRQALEDAERVAERGAGFLRKAFPAWRVGSEGVLDDAARALLRRAESWGADLTVLGTPDRSLLGRFLKGSVTQQVLRRSRSSLRISRPRIAERHRPPLLLLAMDGSAGAEQALRALSARRWPPDTVVRVVAAMASRGAAADPLAAADAAGLLPGRPTRSRLGRPASRLEESVERACDVLAAAGIRAVPAVVPGEPRRVLLAECREWGARALFMGARGLNPAERLILGSVSSALAARAPCTVEVHHLRRMTARYLTERPAPNRKSRRQR